MRAFLLLSVALVAACDKAPEPAPAPVAQAEAAVVPPAQESFLAAAGATSDQAGIDRFCAEFAATPGFDGWLVTVRDSQVSTLNRSVGISFNAGNRVKLEQVVQADNPMHAAVDRLRIGEQVKISGAFTHGNGECGYSLDTFGIRLSAVK